MSFTVAYHKHGVKQSIVIGAETLKPSHYRNVRIETMAMHLDQFCQGFLNQFLLKKKGFLDFNTFVKMMFFLGHYLECGVYVHRKRYLSCEKLRNVASQRKISATTNMRNPSYDRIIYT